MTTRTLFALFTLHVSIASAALPPGILNQQGRIAVNGVNYGGTGHFKFAFVDSGATETFWTNDGSNTGSPGGEPTAAVSITLTNGHYSLGLGDTALTNMSNAIPASVFENNDEVYLRIWFSADPPGTFEQLAPDRRLTSSAYALHAALADGVSVGSINSVMLAAGSVTTGKLAGGAVTAANLADGAVSGLDSIDGLITDVLRVAENGLSAADSDGTNLVSPRSIAVQGDFAYVVDQGTTVLHIFDISDPDNIVARDLDGTNLGSPGSVVVQGNFAYVVDFTTDLLQIFDVSDPDNIVARDSDGTNLATPQSIVVQGSFAYVVDSSSDLLQIFDVSDPNNIVSRGSAGTMLSPRSVAVQGSFVYVAGREPVNNLTPAELQIFDVSDPDNIVLRDSDGTNLFDPETVAIQGDFVYIVDNFLLQIFDVSNPDNIVPRGGFQGTTSANYQAGAVAGNYAYVVDSIRDVLQIFDISNPDAIVIGDMDGTNLSSPTAVAVQGDYAYVVDSSTDLLQIFALVPEVRIDRNLEVVGARVGIGTNAPVTDLHVAGDAFVTGSLLDSSQAPGTAGQALFSTGAGTAWTSLLDEDPANELQSISLVDATITLSHGGGSINLVDAGGDADPDPANELQTLSLLGTNLTLSDGGGTVSINDPDADPTNELQTLRLTGTDLALSSVGGSISIEDADADPSNELQTMSLAGNTLSLSNGGNADLSQFLRSDASDAYTTGTMTFNAATIVRMNGALQVEHSDGIRFDGGAESIKWLNATDSFATTAGMWVQGPFRAGGNVGIFWDFHSIAIGGGIPASPAMVNQNDLWIEGSLEIGDDLYLSGVLTMNTAESDQFLYFYEDGSLTGESLKWDNASDRFEFSDNASISSSGNTSQLRLEQTSASNFARLELATTDGGLWRIAAQGGAGGDLRFFNGARDRMILEDNGDLDIDGTLSQGSDRHRKENILPVDPAEVLKQVVSLPIARWNYRDDTAATPHLGPMSQDFHAAFQVGDDERRIPAVDADGVALAAIQGLNSKVEARDERIEILESENSALRIRLEKLERAVEALSLEHTN